MTESRIHLSVFQVDGDTDRQRMKNLLHVLFFCFAVFRGN